MNFGQIINIIIILVLTMLSGIGDSQGFVHAALVWKKGQIVWEEILKSTIGFSIGILLYWIVIRFLNNVGIISPEIQTVGWFGVTIVAIAITSGDFSKWSSVDKIVSLLVLSGIGWLMFHGK